MSNGPDDIFAAVDAWTATRRNAVSLTKLSEEEGAHGEWIQHEFGRLLDQSAAQFGSLLDLIDGINLVDKADWPAHRATQYVLIAYNVRSFRAAMHLLRLGYVTESVAILRVLYETYLRVLFVSLFPEDQGAALVRKPPPGVTQFNVTGFVKDHLQLEWEKNYGIMSAITHSNTHKVTEALVRAAERDGPPERFGATISRDEEAVLVAAPFLQFLLLAYLRFCRDRLAAGFTEDAVVDPADEAIEWLSRALRGHPKPYWHEVHDDLDVVARLLDAADDDGDWRAVRDRTRGRETADGD